MWSGVTNGGQKEGTKGTYRRRKEDEEWYDSEGKKGKRRRWSGDGNESEFATGFQWSFAPDSPRALLKRNYGGKSCRTHANHDRERRRGRRRCGAA